MIPINMNGKEKIEFLLSSSKRNREPFPHLLLLTEDVSLLNELARNVSEEMGVNQLSLGPDLHSSSDLYGVLTNLRDGDILVIPCVHSMSRKLFQCLAKAMEELKLDLLIDTGPNARTVQVRLHRFSVLASAPETTRKLFGAFLCTIEGEDVRSIGEDYAMKILQDLNLKTAPGVLKKIIALSQQKAIDVGPFLKNFHQYLRLAGEEKHPITPERVDLYLRFSGMGEDALEKNNRNILSDVKREVWRRDNGQCVVCKSNERLEYDHIIPFVRGGSNTARNIQLLCESCNRAKGAKVL